MPLSPVLAVWLKSLGHDAAHACELELAQAPDFEILEQARREKRVIVTADLDFPRLLALAQSTGPGLMLFRGGNYAEQESVDRLRTALAVIPNDQLPHSIVVIEKGRIRQRRLPLP